jgi:hypothetical protein
MGRDFAKSSPATAASERRLIDMIFLRLIVLGLTLFLWWVNPHTVRAGWGTGSCGWSAAPVYYHVAFSGWYPTDSEEMALYADDVQIGSVRLSDGAYFKRLRPGVWEGPCACPVELPAQALAGAAKAEAAKAKAKSLKKVKDSCACCDACQCGDDCQCPLGKKCHPDCGCLLKVENKPLFGCRMDKVSKEEKCTVNGVDVSKRRLKQALQAGGTVPDDSAKLSLTLIGNAEDRTKARNDLYKGDYKEFLDHVVIQEYDPTDVMVAKYGFATKGNPTVYLQRPDNPVPLWHEDDYKGKQTWDAVRKADPLYDPSKDPGIAKPAPKPANPDLPLLSGLVNIPPAFLLLGGLGTIMGIAALMKKKVSF